MPGGKHSGALGFYSAEWVRVRLPAYHHEIESLFDELIHQAWGRAVWQPSVEIVETAEAYIVEADLPGVTADNVRVSVQDHRLAITGERPRSAEERTGRVHVSERPTGPFVRVIEFRVDVDGRKLRHQLENGVLRVVVPKRKAEGA